MRTIGRTFAALACASLLLVFTACSGAPPGPVTQAPPGSPATAGPGGTRMPPTQPTASGGGATVAVAAPDPTRSQTLYLWEEGNVPATTVYTENTGGYADDPDFRPTLTSVPVPAGTPVKGAVLLNPEARSASAATSARASRWPRN